MRLDELRQQGEVEHRHLWIERAAGETLPEHRPGARAAQGHGRQGTVLMLGPQGHDPEPDQIGGAHPFDHGEGQGRGHQHSREAGDGGDQVDIGAGVDAEHGNGARALALSHAPAEQVGHVGTRREHQQDAGPDEQPIAVQ